MHFFYFSGAKNLSEPKNFDAHILNAALEILDSINQVYSAGSLQWLNLLLFKVAHPDNASLLSSKCTYLLTKIANELHNRTNPYHLLLRSRYGLYGTPLEPELFDIEPPPPAKPSSTAVTYATVVAGDNTSAQNVDYQTTYGFFRENLDPREVMSTSVLKTKIKLKNMSLSKMVKGLLETEPLHFACVAASDGTRIERADSSNSSAANNKFTYCSYNTGQSSGTKKENIKWFISEMADTAAQFKNDKSGSASSSVNNNNNNNSVQVMQKKPFKADNMEVVYELLYHPEDDDFTKLRKYPCFTCI